ncbi:hypothetical protein [Cryobacterium sp.]|uniref:hypothetical protein n=1 Tax=Cryobacterium sp. TaxID=1926290 RepID=UPI00261F9584|nr:hypothetical protein [Cryobacterium sp.]MCU1447372.1 hypothetical protein [Cryobacterium sp.]
MLDELQETEKIAAANRVTLLPITVDSQSVLDQRIRFIAVAATGLGGATLTLLVAGLVDGLSSQRKRRKDFGAEQELADISSGPDLGPREDRDRDPILATEATKATTLFDPSSRDREPDTAPTPVRSAR